MLHVLNGDATRSKLERSDVPGTFAVWADALHEGPVPGEEATPEEWRETRARYIGAVAYATYEEALRTLREWDEAIERFPEHDEVVIWCEHDLFDQLLLIRHLHGFGRRGLGDTRLSLICIDGYPGVPDFKGLGQLDPDQLATLLATRRPITRGQMELGRSAWLAFTSPDPSRLQEIAGSDTSPLPFLGRALRRLLEELPSRRNGLSRTQERILRLLGDGPRRVPALFRAVHDREDAFYIADLSFRTVLDELASPPSPAVRLELEEDTGVSLPDGAVHITDTGRALLAGRADWLRLHGVDRWLGGVHLRDAKVAWRWDADRQRPVRS